MAIMVSDALIYHPSVAHYLRYVATTLGRDKVLRTLQYFSRFYAWYLSQKQASITSISPFAAIKTQFGLTRKIMRIGKFVEHFKAASESYDAVGKRGSNDLILQYLGVLRQLGYGFYMTFDVLTVLDAAGIKKSAAAKRFQARAYQAWLSGLVASAVTGLYLNYKLSRKALTIDEKDGEAKLEAKKIEKQRASANLQLLSDICDLTIPATALGYVQLNDGIVGLAGTLSSLIGARAVWEKTRA